MIADFSGAESAQRRRTVRERMLLVAVADPELTTEQLAERFQMPVRSVRNLLADVRRKAAT